MNQRIDRRTFVRSALTAGIYGSLPLGNAELFLLDTREYRDDQPM